MVGGGGKKKVKSIFMGKKFGSTRRKKKKKKKKPNFHIPFSPILQMHCTNVLLPFILEKKLNI